MLGKVDEERNDEVKPHSAGFRWSGVGNDLHGSLTEKRSVC